MLKDWIDEETLKRIDSGDVKMLFIGLVLLLVPVVFFILYILNQGPKSFGTDSAQRQLMRRNSVFNFSPQVTSSTGSTAKPTSKPAPDSDFFPSPKEINRELEAAMKKLEQTEPIKINIPGLPEEKRLSLEADLNPNYRRGCAMLETNNLAESEQAFIRALESANNNVFLQVYSLGGLMEVYSRQGNKKDFEEVFERYMNAVATLPGGLAADLPLVMKNTVALLKQFKDLDLSKVDPALLAPLNIDKNRMQEAAHQSLENFPEKILLQSPGG
ncbi:MAG: hypothetical protein HQM10_06795 [Candidatus Riflebacteria bacterium]|nr:hypothetical protein [Candidatus Riflebacteria bacterium]